ncbi:MAG: Uma2 family endonuclease [Chloroherpetonaceae bacterium]|nr:Uma2 family endonuclease [Chloroherpetonaceae bacterium]
MAEKQLETLLSPSDYLALERASDVKHEYVSGELRLMAGASKRHILITINLASALRKELKGKPCKTYANEMKITVGKQERYFYPDISVICGNSSFIEDDVAADAVLIAEVLSPSTEKYDRGEKFKSYQNLPSLKDYLLVSQEKKEVEWYHKVGENEWHYSRYTNPNDELHFDAIGAGLKLEEVYEEVWE